MSKLNNADAKFVNRFAFMDCEVVDEEQKIWRGKPVVKEDVTLGCEWMYFSRLYSPDNDLDRMLQEYTIDDEEILGVKFVLVPREKLLFTYNSPTTIIIPPRKIAKGMRGT